MITGHIDHLAAAGLAQPLYDALVLALAENPAQKQPDSYTLDGERLFMNVMTLTTQPPQEKKPSCTGRILIFNCCWKAVKLFISASRKARVSWRSGIRSRITSYATTSIIPRASPWSPACLPFLCPANRTSRVAMTHAASPSKKW